MSPIREVPASIRGADQFDYGFLWGFVVSIISEPNARLEFHFHIPRLFLSFVFLLSKGGGRIDLITHHGSSSIVLIYM